jgi:FemAB family.
MKLEIKLFDEIENDIWDNFIRENSMGYAYHLSDVLVIDRCKDWENISFAISNRDIKNNIVMCVQLYKQSVKPEYHRGYQTVLHSRWGFVVKDGLLEAEKKKIAAFFRDYIDKLFENYDVDEYRIELPPLSLSSQPENFDIVNPVMLFGFKPSIRYTYVIDITKTSDELLAGCEQTTRQAIRKIKNIGKYEVVRAKACEKDYHSYVDMHKETYTRTGAQAGIISEEYHKNMFYNLLPKGICQVYFLKEKEMDENVAAVTILKYKNTAYYWWGCSRDSKEVGVNKYLLFSAIIQVKKELQEECSEYSNIYFETGGAKPYLRQGKYKGLNDFKKCFGTFLHPIFQGDYRPLNRI